MKPIQRFLALFLLFTILLFFFAYVYIKTHGRELTQKVFRYITQQEVTFDKIKYQFPLGVLLSHVRVGTIGEIQNISFQVKLSSILSNQLHIKNIVFEKPSLRLMQEKIKGIITVSPGGSGSVEEKVKNTAQRNDSFVFVDDFMIDQGRIDYLQDNGRAITLSHVDLRLEDIVFPRMNEMPFSLSFNIVRGVSFLEGGTAEVRGKLNWRKQFIDGKAEYDDDKNKVAATADIRSQDGGIITVSGRAKIAPNLGNELGRTQVVQTMFKGQPTEQNISVETDFSFVTKWGEFSVENIEFKGDLISSPQ